MTYNLNFTNFQKYNTSRVVESEIEIKKYFKILAPCKRMKDNIGGGTSSLSNRVAHRGGGGIGKGYQGQFDRPFVVNVTKNQRQTVNNQVWILCLLSGSAQNPIDRGKEKDNPCPVGVVIRSD